MQTDNLENKNKKLIVIDIVKANIYAVLLLIPLLFIYVSIFYLIWGDKYSIEFFSELLHNVDPNIVGISSLSIIITMLIGIIFHELLHGIIWALYARNAWKSIHFGFKWQMLTPYCHCSEPLLVKHYIWGAAAPGIILGIAPFVASLAMGSIIMLAFSIFFTLAAIGDFMIIYLLRKTNGEALVQDHETEAGCWVYE